MFYRIIVAIITAIVLSSLVCSPYAIAQDESSQAESDLKRNNARFKALIENFKPTEYIPVTIVIGVTTEAQLLDQLGVPDKVSTVLFRTHWNWYATFDQLFDLTLIENPSSNHSLKTLRKELIITLSKGVVISLN